MTEREFYPSEMFAAESERPERRQSESDFSREAQRWAKRALLAIPLLTGCGAERPVKEWAERTLTPQQTVTMTGEHQEAPLTVFVDHKSGKQYMPQEVKVAIDEVLDTSPAPSIVEPEHRHASGHGHHRGLRGTAELPTDRMITGHEHVPGVAPHHDNQSHPDLRSALLHELEPPHLHENPSDSDDHHAGETTEAAANHTPGASRADGHNHAHQHHSSIGGGENLDSHGHVEIPILSGAGNFLIGIEKRSLVSSGSDDEHIEFGLQGQHLYAGFRPGAELKVSDHGEEYSITLSKAGKDWGITGKFRVAGGDHHGEDEPPHDEHAHHEEDEGAEHEEAMPVEIHQPSSSIFDRVEFEATTKYGKAGFHEGKLYVAPEVTVERIQLGGIFEMDRDGHKAAVLRITLK